MKNTVLFPLAMISGFSVLSLSYITTSELMQQKRRLHERLHVLTLPTKYPVATPAAVARA